MHDPALIDETKLSAAEHSRSPRAHASRADGSHVPTIIRWFDLPVDAPRHLAKPPAFGADTALAPPPAGQVWFVGGASGAGKSSRLRALRERSRDDVRWIDVAGLALPADRPVIDCFGRLPLVDALRLLSRVGLGEVWTYLRPPPQLSDGQRWRLRMAIALARASPRRHGAKGRRAILLADEFAALLDRVSAAVVARALRRAVTAEPTLAAVVATSHDDLLRALQPDRIIRCDFDAPPSSPRPPVERRPGPR